MSRPSRSLSLIGTVFFCVLSGLLLSLAFPPTGWWPLAWVALVPWIASLRHSSRSGAFFGSLLGGLVFFGGLLSWLYLFGLSVWILVSLLLAGGLALWGLAVRALGNSRPFLRLLGTAALWCALEWLRGLGQYGFTWGWLGYSQSPAPLLLPLARYLGTLGLSFAMLLVSAGLAELFGSLLRRTPPGVAFGRAVLACSASALMIGVASLRLRGGDVSPTPPVRMAVIQGNEHGPLTVRDVNVALSAEERDHTLQVYDDLTVQAARQQPALVVWPESVLAGAPEGDPVVAARVSAAVRRSNVWLLAGGPGVGNGGGTTNSAYLYSPTGNIVARYDKVQLVPFGEYVPLRSRLPFLSHYNVRASDFVPGPVHSVLQAGTVALGPMICFESTFPLIGWELTRDKPHVPASEGEPQAGDRRAYNGAQVLVILTNDSWFGYTAAPAQHQQIAVLRAVENGRWVLRAASTGLSSIIAPDGRVVRRAGLYEPAVLTSEVRLLPQPAPSVVWGPRFGWAMAGLAVFFLFLPCATRRSRRARFGRAPRARPSRVGPRRSPSW